MPALDVENPGVSAVASFESLLQELLAEAESAKPETTIEPALSKADFNNLGERAATAVTKLGAGAGTKTESATSDQTKSRQFAIIETAARDIFSGLIATTTIDSPEFVKVWNLFDILSILSDDGQCDPALLFWLAEELLDSQTIAGCRKIFDYLESRRERITSKHFKQKQLIILRSCNELLRRLSRAEDTAFCGRVFIFMFQSFPLGDKSSVNLRGEYHVENVTSYEETPAEEASEMDVDTPMEGTKESGDSKPATKGADTKKGDKDKPLEPGALYPLFWSLQESFSQPKKLFETDHLASFKQNLGATMRVFGGIHTNPSNRKSADDSKRNLKRKREGTDEDSTTAFNPKYLTSRDLFKLEISDLSFRRHVLVQSLIIMDFLLSLSAQAKEKLATIAGGNKAVMYLDQVLNEDDTKWANDMKKTISDYLKQGPDGPYFYRMVETVLARDKNWVRWKIEGCQPIKRDPVSPASFVDAKATVQRTATSKRLRAVPMGAVPLDFLKEESEEEAMAKLKAEERYCIPDLDSFKRGIADDDFEIKMPTNDETKANAIEGKASKSWRALRIAARYKLAAFDKIDNPKKIDVVFEELVEVDEEEEGAEAAAAEEDLPSNREPVIISGVTKVGKTAVIEKLMAENPGVFAIVVRHTTREPAEGEVQGKSFHFVPAKEFNQLRDADRLVECGTRGEHDYGTSIKAIDAVKEAGKIPVIELDLEAAEYAKDMGTEARYVLVKTSSPEVLEQRLKDSDEKPSTDLDESKVDEIFQTTIISDDLDQAAQDLRDFVYEKTEDGEENMEDDEPAAEGEATKEDDADAPAEGDARAKAEGAESKDVAMADTEAA